jgi:hypothetical protein
MFDLRLTSITAMALGATLLLSSCASRNAEVFPASDYGVDRAMIEDLQARYLFAMDFRDAASYASTFTQDGVLDYGAGQLSGRQAIHDMVARTRERAATQAEGEGPPHGRHSITSMVINVDGDHATSVAYWFLMVNDPPDRVARVHSYGHYEDELVKVDGEWLFSLRKIYNEGVPVWSWLSDGNPAVTPGPGPGKQADPAK